MLSTLLKNQFETHIRSRGTNYFYARAVKLVFIDDFLATEKKIKHLNESNYSKLEFEVLGSEIYFTTIEKLTYSEFELNCSCPYFEESGVCKHLWASVLYCDEKKIFATQNKEVRSANSGGVNHHGPATWMKKLQRIEFEQKKEQKNHSFSRHTKNEMAKVGFYAIDLEQSLISDRVVLKIFIQERLKKGGLGVLKEANLTTSKIQFYEDPTEKQILWELFGMSESNTGIYRYSYEQPINQAVLSKKFSTAILKKISLEKKLFYLKNTHAYNRLLADQIKPCSFDEVFWFFSLKLIKVENKFKLAAVLKSENGEEIKIEKPQSFIEGLIFFDSSVARSNIYEYTVWYEATVKEPLIINEIEIDDFLNYYFSYKDLKPPIELPLELEFSEEVFTEPKVQLSFELDKISSLFRTDFSFIYGSKIISSTNPTTEIYDLNARKKIIRNTQFEVEQKNKFFNLIENCNNPFKQEGLISSEEFPYLVEESIKLGWQVLVKDQKIQLGKEFKIHVSSGIDWFDLNVDFQFGQQWVSMPTLISAIRSGQRLVKLGDGTTGVLPIDWIKRFSPILSAARESENGLRLSKVQALFFSANLDIAKGLENENKVSTLQTLLTQIQELKPLKTDLKLKGKLRSYQKKGLSWLSIITENELGGILADDMGLGKTIQVLALLSFAKQNSKASKANKFPTLIVAPKSLVFNWKAESEKFTPYLKSIIYAGSDRQNFFEQVKNYDLVLTTYQTLRIDIDKFQSMQFEYLILDEAHYIKNAKAQITMAVRLIKAQKKVALTGTPVENSLMDLFTILSTVTPGLISDIQAERWAKETDPEKIQTLGKAISPFLLRRTKDQVLKDLPEKSEQVLYCELSSSERKKYNDLKKYYWLQLSDKIKTKGLQKSKIEVLEAILRLRQASCHQGLIDPSLSNKTSSKFELVLEQFESLLKEKRKILVFSQFTSLLKLFSSELTQRNIQFEYLDGQTEDRKTRVENFQNSENCLVFLLSLKAGGVGLNLTAAECVFILDPWWNPAAESQAIDRAHRIGQKRKVFAYKIIAKDTIEEKILEMQTNKKSIADAIVTGKLGLMKSLSIDDLQELFL